jgi:PAS domain S-box-containing protein
VAIAQYQPEQNQWVYIDEYRQDLSLPKTLGFIVPDEGNPFAEQLKRLEVVVVNDTDAIDDSLNQEIAQTLPGAWLLFPLVANDAIWGALVFLRSKPAQPYAQDEIELAQQVADQLQIAIHQAELYRQVEEEKQKLLKSQTALVQAQHIAELGNWELDARTHAMAWSENLFHIFGFDPAAPDPDFAEVMVNHVHPDDRPRLEQALMTTMTEGTPYEIDLRIFRADGSLGYMEARAEAVRDDQGDIVKVVGTSLDISDRKQAELEIRQLNQALEAQNHNLETLVEQRTAELIAFINAMPDYVYVVERGTQKIQFCNDQLAAVTHFGERKKVQGKSVFECFPPENAGYFAEQNLQVFESGSQLRLQESFHLPSGEIHVDTYKIPLKQPNGETYALIGTSRDITELVRARRALTERTVQLEAANQELESFSYSVSHDLRAPLRHIHGFVRALQQRLATHDALTDPKVAHYLQVIDSSSQKMAHLIDGLLTLSRIGRKPMTTASVSLHQLVEEAIAVVQPQGDSDSTAKFKVGPLPVVQGDATLLQQVLTNLIGNAVKFSSHHPVPQIEIGSLPHEVIFIRDNGAGFQMDYADKLFGAFQRLHSQTEFEGTGIGLAIVQRIIHRHGGRIWAESAPDQGATFYFTIGCPPG